MRTPYGTIPNTMRDKKRDWDDGLDESGRPRRKAKKLRTEATPVPDEPFRFFDLPPELRNNIYEKVLENEPAVWLSRTKKQHTHNGLQTRNSLILVSKLVKYEFMGMLITEAPMLLTEVRNLDFSHVITFFNRLSEIDMEQLTSKKRTLQVELVFSGPRWVLYQLRLLERLERWRNRSKTTKRGVDVDIELVWDKEDELVTSHRELLDQLVQIEAEKRRRQGRTQ